MSHVSVVLAVYNGAATLSEAIETILAQSHRDFEFIIIDDASTDGSLAIIDRYVQRDDRIMVLVNEHNAGLSVSLNRAIASARGDYIMRMDQDDLSLSSRLERQATLLDRLPEVGLVSCYVDSLFSMDALPETRSAAAAYEHQRRHLARTPQAINAALAEHNVFHHGEVMFRRALWSAAGGYRAEFEMSEDYDLWLRMVPFTTFRILEEILYLRRFGRLNASHVYDSLQRFTAHLAQQCHKLRMAGHDDSQFSRLEILSYLREHGLAERFALHIDPEARPT